MSISQADTVDRSGPIGTWLHGLRSSAALAMRVCIMICIATGGFVASALADKAGCEFKDIDVGQYGEKPFRNPPELVSRNGVLKTELSVEFTDPAAIQLAGCPLHLRTYNGQLIGPTLRIRPGDRLAIDLRNNLPIETPAEIKAQFEQERENAHLGMFPAAYNTTNLHTHGLHVSPEDHGDNVLVRVEPGSAFSYNIPVPSDHPPGSFWYHAHAHGSTSIQVGSGMAGALIIEDDPARIPAALAEANKSEKILVLQTLLCDREGELNQIAALFPGPSSGQNCETWPCSKRRATVNGQIVPVISMRPGEVQRWRIVDAAFRQTFELRLEGHALHEIALDGLYLGHIDTWNSTQAIELQPGYRTDLLVQASMTKGTYQLVSGRPTTARAIEGVVPVSDSTIALVRVEGDPVSMALPTNAEMANLAPFPGIDLRKTATGVQQVVFKLGSDVDPDQSKSRLYFQVNYEAFDEARVRKVVLGATDQWSLSTVGNPPGTPQFSPAPHVFHIHVNPFQVIRKDPSGTDELVWRDTVLVPTGTDANGNTVSQTLNIYTRYTDFLGKFVMHCHILDHEDLGMMEVVEVVRPEDMPMLLMMGSHQHH